jgi:hypothetical protein
MRVSRREMLQLLIASTATTALPFKSFAAAPATPKRVIFVYTPEGIWGGNSRRAQDWMVYKSQTDFTPVGMALPLSRHRGDLVVFENLSNIYDNNQPQIGGADGSGIETHSDGKAMILTNTDMVNFVYGSGRPQGQSLDLFLAGTIGKSYTPAWPSLQLGVATDNSASSTMTYQSNGSPVISQRDPAQVYKSLFSSNTLSKTLDRRAAVLKHTDADLTRLAKRIPSEIQNRTNLMVDAVKTMEQRLTASSNMCGNVSAPGAANLNLADGKNANVQSEEMIKLITTAFSCDLTRVVTLVYQGVYGSVHAGLMGGVDDEIHSTSHYDTPDAQSRAKQAMYEQIAKLADSLKAVPEGSGTMLDNTLICTVTEVNADHDLSSLPFATIGGKNLGVQVGNYLKLPMLKTSANGASQGFPHGNLLRSIIKALGLPEQSFGNPKYSDRLVPGFLK